jgi:hypothetical protein
MNSVPPADTLIHALVKGLPQPANLVRLRQAKRKKKAGARRESDIAWGGKASPGARHINIGLGAIVVILTVAGGAYWFLSAESERTFQAVADQGRARLADLVTTDPNHGRGHGQHGATYHYTDLFPTSGRHDPVPTSPGVYRLPQRSGQLVHALEHGNVVIYYDTLGEEVVLTAWTKTLRLEPFDAALAAAFIDRYRGRGPEHPVRVVVE